MWIKTENGNYVNSDHIAAIGMADGDTVAVIAGLSVLEPLARDVNVCETVIQAIISGEKYMEV